MNPLASPTTRHGEIRWAELAELIAERLGLHFPPEREADLERGLVGAAAALGFDDVAACADWMLSASPTRTQLHLLASHLTIGETYFLRDTKTFDALASRVLPDLIRARRGNDQTLRLWSAGCSSGEEAYSLAILLCDLLPDLASWRVTILATDVNESALRKAAHGAYGDWSFRDAPDDFKERHFVPDERGRLVVRPHIKSLVTFASLNLAEDIYPSVASGTHAMDIVFCRNVLMYFTPAQMQKVIGRLHRSLSDDGWLVVSPSEASQALFTQFITVNRPGAILYRKGDATGIAPDAALPELPGAVEADAWPAVPADLPLPAPPPVAKNEEPPSYGAMARAAADEGRLDDARAWCERWIASDKLDPARHFLLAAILLECGDPDEARASLGRALYLEPRFVLAHFALGNLAARGDRPDLAGQHFADTLDLLRQARPDDLLPEGDGLTAGRLMEVVTAMTRRRSAR